MGNKPIVNHTYQVPIHRWQTRKDGGTAEHIILLQFQPLAVAVLAFWQAMLSATARVVN